MHRSGRTCRESPQSREVLKREVLTSRCSGEDLGSVLQGPCEDLLASIWAEVGVLGPLIITCTPTLA